MGKTYIDKNVYEAAQERIKFIFDEFENVLVSFSCGKDSAICLNMFYDYAKEHNCLDRLAMYYMDYEADYESTDEFAKRSFEENFEGIKKYWLCLPISAQCSCSMTETYWIPWDEDKKDIWVKEMPDNEYVVNEHNVPFDFVKGSYGADTRKRFTQWFSSEYGKTAVIVGIRCDESLNRLAIVTSQHMTGQRVEVEIQTCQKKGKKVETEDEALVAVHNGVVNVYEKDPAEHFIDWKEARKRDYVFTTKWARDYNPNAKQPVFHDTENNRDGVVS